MTQIHKSRITAVVSATSAVIEGGSVVPADIGRALAVKTSPKHGIKRIDRLLGNEKLHSEAKLIYGQVARLLLGGRPVILVDWSKLDGGKQAVLAAAVAHSGRAIPIYIEAHPMSLLANPKVEANFIKILAKHIVPAYSKPIIVTDAGYRNPWFKKVIAEGWDFVGRASLRISVIRDGEKEWKPLSFYNTKEIQGPKEFGKVRLAKSNPLTGRIITVKVPSKARKGHTGLDRKGLSSHGHTKTIYRKRYENTAIVFTSIFDLTPIQICKIYSTRMQIEESFRSAKSHRFGYSQQNTRSNDCNRLNIIFLLISLAMIIQILLGSIVEHLGLQKQFQSNTESKRRIISLFMLGGMALRHPKTLEKLKLSWLQFSLKLAYSSASLSTVIQGVT